MTSDSTPAAKKRGRWLNRLFWLLALCALLLALGLFRAELLTALARVWMVDEPVPKADAILVVGGKVDDIPLAAARLFKEGKAPLVLVIQSEAAPTAQWGLAPAEHVIARDVLLQKGVPADAIHVIGTNVTTLFEAAQAVRGLAQQAALHSIIIPTGPLQTRRARWVFKKTLQEADVQITVTAIAMKSYRLDDWWQHEEGLADFQNEAVRFLRDRWNH